jgi:cell division protein FtsI/penicillin-binding protein 2
MAVEILQKDLHRIPRYVYVLLVGIVLLFFILGLIYYAKKIKQEKHQQENILQDFQQQKSSYYQQRAQEIERKINILQEDNNWQHTIQWKKYDSLCRYFDEHFFLFSHKLQEKQIYWSSWKEESVVCSDIESNDSSIVSSIFNEEIGV